MQLLSPDTLAAQDPELYASIANEERRQRDKTAPKAIENPELAPARGHAANFFSLSPSAIGQAATNPQ